MGVRSVEARDRAWRDPLAVAAGLRHLEGPLALLSDGGGLGRWSFVAAEPDLIHVGPTGPGAALDILRRPDRAIRMKVVDPVPGAEREARVARRQTEQRPVGIDLRRPRRVARWQHRR